MGSIFRAPGGKTSPALLKAAASCGWTHVGWAPAGFLGDELSSARYPNAALLERALREIRAGDVLVAHLGIWSRQDPWAPAVLEPLIVGLKERGFCFATLREHPAYQGWIAAHGRGGCLLYTSDLIYIGAISFEWTAYGLLLCWQGHATEDGPETLRSRC